VSSESAYKHYCFDALGISHFLLRNKSTGKFERITDPDKIEAAMNADEEYYRIYTKDPNVQCFYGFDESRTRQTGAANESDGNG